MHPMYEADPAIGFQEQAPKTHVPTWRRRLVGALMAGVATLGLVGGPEEAFEPRSRADKVAAALDALPDDCTTPPDTAEGWSRTMIEDSYWLTGDAVFSQVLPDGRVILFTSDSIGGDDEDGYRFNRNAMLVACNDKAVSVAPWGEAIPSNEKGEWYWPLGSIIDGDKMYVSVNRIAPAPGEMFPFKGVGVDLAVFSVPKSTDEIPTFQYMASTPSSDTPDVDSNKQHATLWPSSMYKADGYIHIHGGKLNFLSRNVYVARVPEGQLESLNAWQYWDGKEWSASEQDAYPVIDTLRQVEIDGKKVGEPGLDAAWVSFVDEQGTITMISIRDGFLGKEVGKWTADKPQGPFTYTKLAEPPYIRAYDDNDCHYNYLAYAQPGIRLKSVKMLVTVSNNIKSFAEGNTMVEFPDDYNVNLAELSLNPAENNNPEKSIAPTRQPQGDCKLDYNYTPPTRK